MKLIEMKSGQSQKYSIIKMNNLKIEEIVKYRDVKVPKANKIYLYQKNHYLCANHKVTKVQTIKLIKDKVSRSNKINNKKNYQKTEFL